MNPLSRATRCRLDMADAGSFATAGQGRGLVVASGDGTQVGQISTSLQQQVNLSTPLSCQSGRFSRTLLNLNLGLAAVTFLIGVWRGQTQEAIVRINLAIGVNRLACIAIIRHLPAVESLGTTSVICSDKTGTLTQNRMTVQEVFAGGRSIRLEDLWPDAAGISVMLLTGDHLDPALKQADMLLTDANVATIEAAVLGLELPLTAL